MPHVTICVCTRNRPQELAICINSLIGQQTDFSYDIVCVENDADQKSKATVESLIPKAQERGVALSYYCQPEQNIGLTRNCCIEHATGAFLAFIDDDEYAAPDWLAQLVAVQAETGGDVITGVVEYQFPEGSDPEFIVLRFPLKTG